MLTRLKVTGFKNLVNTEIFFGPFTCIAGPNAVGKSNLFDAIRFLSFLSKETLIDAALTIRAEKERSGDIRSLFHRVGNVYSNEMSFEADMIIPNEGIDDLGQKAVATITFVNYKIKLGYKLDQTLPTIGALELLEEDLEHINLGQAGKLIKFPHNARNWRKSVLRGRRTSPFISTKIEEQNRIIKLSQDGSGGRPKSFLAGNLPRTVLSTVNATESPTALLTRKEMQSWRLLQLEPKSLREPDKFTTNPGLLSDGSHLPATLYYLARKDKSSNDESKKYRAIYDRVALRLSELIDDVFQLNIDQDRQRELLTLQITEKDGTIHPARSLSDGTLRFLALTVLSLDPSTLGIVCLEEPENGIHPERIPAMLSLLQDIAFNPEEPIGLDNPLRQVIVNTHSPAVVSQVPDDSLLVAELKEFVDKDMRFKGAKFSWLPDTWRCDIKSDINPVSRGRLLSYLNPVLPSDEWKKEFSLSGKSSFRRVIDRPDLQMQLPFFK